MSRPDPTPEDVRRLLAVSDWARAAAADMAHDLGYQAPAAAGMTLTGTDALTAAGDLVWLAVADVADVPPEAFDAGHKALEEALSELGQEEMRAGMLAAGFCSCWNDVGLTADGRLKDCPDCDLCSTCGQYNDSCICRYSDYEPDDGR